MRNLSSGEYTRAVDKAVLQTRAAGGRVVDVGSWRAWQHDRDANAASIVQIRPLYLDRSDAAAFLALSESTLDVLVARGDAPTVQAAQHGWSTT